MSGVRRGGIPGPESRTGLVRPAMSEAEFERRLAAARERDRDRQRERDAEAPAEPAESQAPEPEPAEAVAATAEPESTGRGGSTGSSGSGGGSGSGSTRSRARSKPAAKARRVQRMFAIEEDLDKKLWLYAIHVGKDRSDVVNDLLRPVVASMVLYDSRDRRSSRSGDGDAEGPGGDCPDRSRQGYRSTREARQQRSPGLRRVNAGSSRRRRGRCPGAAGARSG